MIIVGGLIMALGYFQNVDWQFNIGLIQLIIGIGMIPFGYYVLPSDKEDN